MPVRFFAFCWRHSTTATDTPSKARRSIKARTITQGCGQSTPRRYTHRETTSMSILVRSPAAKYTSQWAGGHDGIGWELDPECSRDGELCSEAARGDPTQRRTVCASSYSDGGALTSTRLGHDRTCVRLLPRTMNLREASGPQRAHGNVLYALWNGHAPEVRWHIHAIGRRASRGGAPQPKINHTAYRRGEETCLPASKRRNQHWNRVDGTRLQSARTNFAPWRRLLPAFCQRRSSVLATPLACAQAADESIKMAGLRLQTSPVCGSRPLSSSPLSLSTFHAVPRLTHRPPQSGHVSAHTGPLR